MMKSLNQAGVSVSGRWSRWSLCLVLAVVAAGCGGGSDPLGVSDGSGSGGDSSSSVSEKRLLEAYDKVTCGMKIEDVEKLTGAKASPNSSTWSWYESFFEDKAELAVSAQTGNSDPSINSFGFPADGVARAHRADYSYESRGYFVNRDLCSAK
jgi:hypothetical protein